MRVLMLSWEYPPLVVGGLGRHVGALAPALVRAGHEVQVVTRGEKDVAVDEVVDGVHVRRAAVDPVAVEFDVESLLAWAATAEHSLIRAALPLLRAGEFDLVHGHDWLVAQSVATLAETAGVARVVTMHATEFGRQRGHLPAPLNLAIDSIESWLASSADAVIACSPSMHTEVVDRFALPANAVTVVPNGIDPLPWRLPARARRAARARWAGDGPLLAFAGRLVHEKGLHLLLEALPGLRRRHPGLRVVVAGTGPYAADLEQLVARLRLGRAVQWLGFVPDEDVVACFAAADAVVVPSLYEPFGIVALEAAAAGTPLVAAETGGLVDAVRAGLAAASFAPGDVAGLAAAVEQVLADPVAARRVARRAARQVARDCSWTAVAAATAEVYRRVLGRPGAA